MASILSANSARADQVYTDGPETLVAQSPTILAGPVSSYARRVVETSQPPGPDAMPMRWIVSGRLENPRALKGAAAGPIAFSRAEQSVFIPGGGGGENWMRDYGDLGERDEAVLFLSAPPVRTVKVLPSGAGERGLAGLVTDIAGIQSLRGKESRTAAWLAYLDSARFDEGRRAALRSLVNSGADWARLNRALDRFLANPGLAEPMRAFAFGIVSFGLTRHYWAGSQPAVAGFLCGLFESEERTGLLLQYLLALRLVLIYVMEESQRTARQPLRAQIAGCLRRKEKAASAAPELARQYQQIRTGFPGLL